MASTRIELTTLKGQLESWVKSNSLEINYEERALNSSRYCFSANKNDCQIYLKKDGVADFDESRPHISVWLYDDKASVHFCANVRDNKGIIQGLDALVQNGTLSVTTHNRNKRKHYKIRGQIDVDLSQITSADDEKSNSASVVKSVCAQLDALYNIVGSYL